MAVLCDATRFAPASGARRVLCRRIARKFCGFDWMAFEEPCSRGLHGLTLRLPQLTARWRPAIIGGMRYLKSSWYIVFAAALTFVSPPDAVAQTPKREAFDPNRIEFATPDWQSSECLGDTRTVLCAAQTSIVCSILFQRSECRHHPKIGKFANPDGHQRLEYAILDAGFVSVESYRAFRIKYADELAGPSFYGWMQPGIAQVRIRHRYCAIAQTDCDGAKWKDSIIVLNRHSKVWRESTAMRFDDYYWFADRSLSP